MNNLPRIGSTISIWRGVRSFSGVIVEIIDGVAIVETDDEEMPFYNIPLQELVSRKEFLGV